ncbi:MAG: NHL repeat-containing protein [Chromatiales bacterium]|nr:NHL repeat-containing protein [Chromatiales bacterium]
MRIVLLFLFTISHVCHAGIKLPGQIVHEESITRIAIQRTIPQRLAGVDEFITITSPGVFAVRGELLYLYDTARQLLYRYNRSTHAVSAIEGVVQHLKGPPSALHVGANGDIYIADPFGHRVLLFNSAGDLIRDFSDSLNLNNPVAIVTGIEGNVYIADGLFSHIVVFSPSGVALRALSLRDENIKLHQIADMASGPQGYYILDKIHKYIVVISADGSLVSEVPRLEVTDPTSITIDSYGDIYISDEADDTIKVYGQNRLKYIYGGTGSQHGYFRMIRGIQAELNSLYVADSANNRIQIFRIQPSYEGIE